MVRALLLECPHESISSVQVNALRGLFVLVYTGIYLVTIAALAIEQEVSTTNGKDPHPFVYFRRVGFKALGAGIRIGHDRMRSTHHSHFVRLSDSTEVLTICLVHFDVGCTLEWNAKRYIQCKI